MVPPRAGHHDLAQMAERVRRAVAQAEITEAGQRVPVAVSFGGSGLPDKNATNKQDPIGLADAAVHTSKESGRDRHVIARHEQVRTPEQCRSEPHTSRAAVPLDAASTRCDSKRRLSREFASSRVARLCQLRNVKR
jgi:hypothetical protein